VERVAGLRPAAARPVVAGLSVVLEMEVSLARSKRKQIP